MVLFAGTSETGRETQQSQRFPTPASRDTSGTLQGQSRDKIDLPPYMKPRCTNAFRVRCHGCTACPTSFSLRRVRDLLHHVLSQAEQSHFLFADPNLSGVLAGRCFNEAFLRQCFQKTFL